MFISQKMSNKRFQKPYYDVYDIAKILSDRRKEGLLPESEVLDLIRCVVGWLEKEIREGDSLGYEIPDLAILTTTVFDERLACELSRHDTETMPSTRQTRFERLYKKSLEDKAKNRYLNILTLDNEVDVTEKRHGLNIEDIEKLQNKKYNRD